MKTLFGLLLGLLMATHGPGSLPAGQGPPTSRPALDWPIDAKIDSVLRMANTLSADPTPPTSAQQAHRTRQVAQLFAPSGYVVVVLPNQTERWVSAAQFLDGRAATGRAAMGRYRTKSAPVRYQFQAAKVVHFRDITRQANGKFSSRATVYSDVIRFANHQPVAGKVANLVIPLQAPLGTDYWQIYELRLIERDGF